GRLWEARGTAGLPSPRTSPARPVSHPVWNRYWRVSPTPSEVPPTAVTQGLDAGQPAVAEAALAGSPPVSSPLSPEEKYTPIPVAAAWISVSLYGWMYPGGSASVVKPYELVTMVASRRSTTGLRAASGSRRLFGAPT